MEDGFLSGFDSCFFCFLVFIFVWPNSWLGISEPGVLEG